MGGSVNAEDCCGSAEPAQNREQPIEFAAFCSLASGEHPFDPLSRQGCAALFASIDQVQRVNCRAKRRQ
jgi:hypothetical protein